LVLMSASFCIYRGGIFAKAQRQRGIFEYGPHD
jgi:hypothetical protein